MAVLSPPSPTFWGAQAQAPTSGRVAKLCPLTQGLGPPCGPLRARGEGRATLCVPPPWGQAAWPGRGFDYLGFQRGWAGHQSGGGSHGSGVGVQGPEAKEGPALRVASEGWGLQGLMPPHIWLDIGIRGMPSRGPVRRVHIAAERP